MPRRKLIPLHNKDSILNLIVPDKPKLSMISGGKKPPGEDWLSELPCGSQFLVRAIKPIGQQMPSVFLLQMGEVLTIGKRARHIRMFQNEQSADMWVDPKGFCETFELYESTELLDEPVE